VGDDHLAELFRQLYPAPHALELPGHPGASTTDPIRAEYLLLPSAGRPRLAVPVLPRAVRLGAVRHLPRPASVGALAQRAALRAVLGVSDAPLRDRVRVHGPANAEDLGAHLSRLLHTPLQMSLRVGGALRANRKPVVELLRVDGSSAGFAKIGGTELTRALVRAEARTLGRLAGAQLRQLTPPVLRYAGAWYEQELLVQQALPVWRRARPDPMPAVGRAMTELAGAFGRRTCAFGASGYRGRLAERLDSVAERPGNGRGLGPALRTIAYDAFAKAEDLQLTFGAWHGDWTPWNTHVTAADVFVWDWERFTTGVPVGMDALHWQLHAAVDAGTPVRAAAAELPQRATQLLAPFGVGRAASAFTVVLYLLDLGARYLADRLDEGTHRLRALGEWLLPVLVAQIDRATWVEGD
jgi:hypothetical protein